MKAVVLLSGGVDSTTCLAGAVRTYGRDEVTALTMFYGQRHDREINSASAVAEHYGVAHVIKDLSSVFTFSDSPLLQKSAEEIPEGSYAEQLRDNDGMAKTYVPYRNGLFLSYAAAIAYSIGASVIYYGAHADDAAGNAYPDCSSEFYKAQDHAIYTGTGGKVSMNAPLINRNKTQVVEMGLELHAPYHLTWSCYKGQGIACGTCGTCIDRKAAFENNGFKDPIAYAQDTDIDA